MCRQSIPVVLLLFDLLAVDGHSTLVQPYSERRTILEALDLSGCSWAMRLVA